MNIENCEEFKIATKQKITLLDANLLLVYLIHQLGIDIEKFSRTSHFTNEDAVLLNQLLLKFGGFYSTPHVITEVSNLAGKLDKEQLNNFRMLLAKYIKNINEEKYIASNDLIYSPVYLKFGITDAALFSLCFHQKVVLITADFPLANYVEKSGFKVINFNHYRQYK